MSYDSRGSDAWKRRLQKGVEPALIRTGFEVKYEIVNNWLGGRGADGAPFDPLSPAYAKKKGTNQRTLWLSGNMANSMRPTRRSSTEGAKIALGFSGEEQRKAQGNYQHADNMMEPSKKLAEFASDVFIKELRRK